MATAVHQTTWREDDIATGKTRVEIAIWADEQRKIDNQGDGEFEDRMKTNRRCDAINDIVVTYPTIGSRIVSRMNPREQLRRADRVWIDVADLERDETLRAACELIGWVRETYAIDPDEYVNRAIERYLNRVDSKGYRGDKRGTTVSVSVVSGNGDAWEREAGTGFTASGTYEMRAAGSSLNRWAGLHWPSVAVPAGATINSATADVYVSATSADDPNGDLHMEDADSPGDFSATADVSGRTITTAFTNWNTTGIGSGFQTSADFTSAVQEVIDRPGWATGQNMVSLWRGARSGGGSLTCRDYGWSSSYAATLDIDYTAGGAGADSGAVMMMGFPV